MDGILSHFVFVAFLCSDFYRHSVGQPEMRLPASQIVLGSTVPASSVFLCRIDDGISIDTIFSMQILRMRDSLDAELDPIVQATISGVSFMNGAPADMVQRGTPGGGLDSASLTSSTLTLTLTTEDIVCTDKGTYQCKLAYQDSQSNILTLVHNATFDTYALPHDVHLTAMLNNVDVTNGVTETNPLSVNVNDAVAFTCTAKIGSDSNILIRWRRTTVFGTANTFNQFNPSTNPSVVTFSDGTASATTTACSYSRSATMTYNVTSAETSRLNKLGFQCYVDVRVNNVDYTTQNPPEFFINPVTFTTSTVEPSTTVADRCGRTCFILLVTCCVIGWVAAVIAIVTSCYLRSSRGLRKKDGASVADDDDNIRHRYVNTSLHGEIDIDVRQNHRSRVDVTETSHGRHGGEYEDMGGETESAYDQLQHYSHQEEHPYLRRN